MILRILGEDFFDLWKGIELRYDFGINLLTRDYIRFFFNQRIYKISFLIIRKNYD